MYQMFLLVVRVLAILNRNILCTNRKVKLFWENKIYFLNFIIFLEHHEQRVLVFFLIPMLKLFYLIFFVIDNDEKHGL